MKIHHLTRTVISLKIFSSSHTHTALTHYHAHMCENSDSAYELLRTITHIWHSLSHTQLSRTITLPWQGVSSHELSLTHYHSHMIWCSMRQVRHALRAYYMLRAYMILRAHCILYIHNARMLHIWFDVTCDTCDTHCVHTIYCMHITYCVHITHTYWYNTP